jgi:CrcB protein
VGGFAGSHVSVSVWLLFLLAAGAGACARYLLDAVVQRRTAGRFPWGTCTVNVSGSFLLGLLNGLALYHALSTDARFVLGVGFCGAYTTFSTFAFEVISLAEVGRGGAAIRTVLFNTVGSLLAAGAGLALAAL